MSQVKQGDTVKIHYTGKLENGTVFDSSVMHGEPIEFTVGEGCLLPDFETGVVGMTPGDTRTIGIPHENAYGAYCDNMVITLERSQIPGNLEIETGQQLQLVREGGQPIIVSVKAVAETTVTLDANHPLAGEDLTFDLQLMEIL